jgi:exonuclease SbcD
MIIAHVADIHLDERPGPSRESLDEQIERLLWIGQDAQERGAGVMLVAGDLYEHTSTVAERTAAVHVLTSWARCMPVVVVYGNHDAVGDLDILARLRVSPHPIWVQERPEVIGPNHHISGLAVACLPWPRKARLVAQAVDASRDLEATARQQMRRILTGFAAQFASTDAARVVLAHAELGSATLDSGQPLTGRADIELSPADLAECNADYVALGHIHKHQVVGDRICYAGSPRQTTFGQDALKGYCLVDVERGRPPAIEHRKAPGRELHTIEAAWPVDASPAGHVGILVSESDVPVEEEPVRPGDIYRLTYSVGEDHRQQAAEQADRAKQQWLAAGAHSVKLDPRVTPTYRTRCKAIREARTNGDRVQAWWTSRDGRPPRAAVMLDKLAELETEVAA